jgi:3-phosphoshikimate 1-carboxyvinyltransferase
MMSDPTTEKNIVFSVVPGGVLQGTLRVPGDKSISHRSIMLGSLANGVTRIQGFLEGEDSLATLKAFRAMGVNIKGPEQGTVVIDGVGLHGLQPSAAPLYLGNSGTSMRLMSGILSGQAFDSVLTGDPSLSSRPMKRVITPLEQMGAMIESTDRGTAPLHIRGGRRLQGMDYTMPMASAQVKSCLLLAGLYAEGQTCVTEPAPTRDHTERMLRGFGYAVVTRGNRICVQGGGSLQATNIDVPADISSAAFFLVGASIAEGSDLVLEHVGINPTRTGVIDILKLMGADIEIMHHREVGGEPVADIRVRSSRLHGIRIPEELVPLAIDEFPALFIAAACAEGETVLTGAEELRVKESDRIQVMADGLIALGIQAQPTPDGIIIQGGSLTGGVIQSHGDHRISMSFAMAALRSSGPVEIHDCANVNTSFPRFVALANGVGLSLTES